MFLSLFPSTTIAFQFPMMIKISSHLIVLLAFSICSYISST
jgi:hypothetical protein